MKNILLLGSSSYSRQQLLTQAGISYKMIGHTANEEECPIIPSLPDLVRNIARLKMKHVVIPADYTKNSAYVLTADTLSQAPNGRICGKPQDREDAISMIKAAQQGYMRTGTAFCLERRVYTEGQWICEQAREGYAQGEYIFHIPDEDIAEYFLRSNLSLQASGAIAIEDYGIQYFKEMNGSFSAIVGLPMPEVYKELQKLNFFK